MNRNLAFEKAIHLIGQPLSLAAILLLLLNDHLLRHLWPSWLTGKLGDFAWLFFFPYALAAFLALFIPRRVKRQVQITGLMTFGLIATIFILTKTLPGLHEALVQFGSWALGFPVGWRRDPSDLLALSTLMASWFIWQRTSTIEPVKSKISTRPAWLLMSIAALLTVANAAQPETGIGCLSQVNNQILACSAFNCFASTDGGLTWESSTENRPMDCPDWFYDQSPFQQVLEDLTDPSILYRSNPGVSIERSLDSGASWLVEYALQPLKQSERAYSLKTSLGNAVVFDPPLDALADPSSSNLIFAMGFSGVLVRQQDGQYTEIGVGKFIPEKPGFGELLLSVLSGEMILALIFGGLSTTTINKPDQSHWLRNTALVISWVAWGATCLIFPPAIQEGAYAYVFPNAGMLASGVLTLVLAAETLIRIGGQGKKLALSQARVWLSSAALFFVPFLLWLLNILPMYYLGLGFGLLMGGGYLILKLRQG